MAASTSPWTQTTTTVDDVDSHYFTLDPSKIPSTETQYEYYAWAPGSIDLASGSKLKTGVLFPLARWTKLRGVYKDNLQSWNNLPQYNVLDGRDIYGKLVEVIFRKDEMQPKPTSEDFGSLFTQGQSLYDSISTGVLHSHPGWAASEFKYHKADTVTDKIVEAVGKGFKFDFSADDKVYPVTDKYIKLRNEDYELLGAGGSLQIPSAAYISETAFNLLVSGGGSYPWQNGNKNRLAVRTEIGVLRWIDCSQEVDLASKANWKLWGDRGTKKLDRGGEWSRCIDPKITLYILPTGNTRLEASELWRVFDAVKEEGLNGDQEYERADGFTEEQLKEYKFLSVSPFNDYCTLIKKEDWISYLVAHPDRQLPLELEAVEAAQKLLKINDAQLSKANNNVMHSTITADKMRTISNTSQSTTTKDTAMGGSATLVAKSFKWDDAEKVIGKSTDEKWPRTANMPAEWFPQSAYSWGGFASGSDPLSGQAPEGLIFGSSECNSVMTRYEKAYQALFLKEDEFRNKYAPDSRKDFQGTISCYSHGYPVLGSSEDSPFYKPLEQFPTHGATDDKADWTNWNKAARWLCFSLGYQLRLAEPSRILGAGQHWETKFYPFQRGFYTVFESEVDLRLLDFLAEKRAEDIKESESTDDGAEPAEPNDKPSDGTAEPTEDDKLWAAVTSGEKKIVVDGITLSNPVLMTINEDKTETEIPATKVGVDENGNPIPLSEHQDAPLSTTPNTPEEFVVKGDVTVLGLTTPVSFSTVKGSGSPGTIERIALPDSVSLGTIIPHFAGSLLDSITLKKPHLMYRSFSNGSKPPGLRIHTDIVLSGALQPASDILQTVFGQTHPALTVAGFLGTQRDWAKPLIPVGFTLSGALRQMEVNLFGVVEVTDIGVDLIASRAVKEDGSRLGYEFGHAFWGSAGVKVPGSVVPMRVDWNLGVGPTGEYSMMMSMQDDAWTDVMGIQGLNIENVQFDVSWNKGDALDSLDLSVCATLALRSGTMVLTGEYSKDKWLLEASLENVDLAMIEEIYEDVFGTGLSAVNGAHDFIFESMRLSISKDGLLLDGKVTVNGYTSASATVSLTTVGVEIKGAVENVTLEGVTIEDASLDVFIGTVAASTTGRPFRVAISGTVKWGSFEIMAGLYIDKISGKDAQWTVYGEFDGDLQLSHLAPEIKGTWLDIDIQQVAFVASNEEETTEQVPNKFKYPVKKGVQVWATVVETIKAVNGVTKTKAGGLTLCAAFTGEELSIDINMLTDQAVTFKKNITTGPMSFEIVASANPHVKASAELFVKVENQTEPLHLQLSLEAGDVTAKAEARMMDGTMWQNPFGLNPQLEIGDLLMIFEIIYEEFLITGIPKDITFSGKMDVGPTKAKAIIQFSEVPTEELVSVEIENLDISTMFHLGNQPKQAAVVSAPAQNETLKFNDLLLYFSTGATVEGTTYPRGIGFKCDMDIFNHNAKVDAVIAEQITIKGSINPFKIGPLTVSGFKDPQANIDIALGPTEKHIKIDGAVTLCDVSNGIDVDIEVSSKPVFKFVSRLAFGELLTFDLNAEMDGEFNGKDTKDLDFILKAEMHDEIIKYIVTEAEAHFTAAHQAAQVEFAVKDAEITAQEKKLTADLETAKQHVAETKEAWDVKHAAVEKAFKDKETALEQERIRKENDLTDAQKKLDDEVRKVENDLEQVKADVAKKVQAAEVAVETAARNAEAKLEQWKRDVAAKQAQLNSAYGNVQNCMSAAQNSLNNAQASVNAKQSQIDSLNQQISHAGFFAKIRLNWDLAELHVEKGVLDAALWVAQKALAAGNACLNEAYTVAQLALNGVQRVLTEGEAGIAAEAHTLEAALEAAKRDAGLLVSAAEAKIEYAKNSGFEKGLFDTAKKLLDTFINGLEDAMKDVAEAYNKIEECAENVAYTIAMHVLDTTEKNIKSLDPARLALTLSEGAEEGLNRIVEAAIKVAGNIFDVRTVTLSGSLKALENGSAPLEVVVIAVLAGKEETFKVDYVPGGVEKFFEGLWKKVHEIL